MAARHPSEAVPAPPGGGGDGDVRPRGEHHHRDVQGGAARAAVFGVSDGLVSNTLLIVGMAGADPSASVVRLGGLISLLAGAVSMAAGEYVSMQAQRELFERELDIERRELRRRPHVEQVELSQIYMARGVPPDSARELAHHMMRDPEIALETHAREELGIDPGALGSPPAAATWSFVAFALGAVVPLAPWFVSSGRAATVASVALAAVVAVVVGWVLASFTGRSRLQTAVRQLLFATVPAAGTFLLGRAVGITTS